MEGLLKLNLPIDSKINDDLWYKQKEQKNSHVNQNFNDVSIPSDGWRDFPSRNLPQNFNYSNVYHYLVGLINKVWWHDDYDNEEYGDEDESIEVTSKPLKKGTCLLKSGFVHNTQDNMDENNKYYILTGHVYHSMKNLLPLNTEVCVSIMSGFVKSARCDCKAGLSG